MKLRYRPGGLRPLTPCGGRVIAFKWPGRPPRKNPGDATGNQNIYNVVKTKGVKNMIICELILPWISVWHGSSGLYLCATIVVKLV